MKILVCAYACLQDPDKRFGNGGEGFLGWGIIEQISKFNKVWVLTHYGNKKAIEKKLSDTKIQNVSFYYIALPKIFGFLEKIGGGVQIYAYLWQIKAYFIAKKLHIENHFDIFHHLTYANDWMASFIGALLPVKYVRGPGGGAHYVPKEFVREYSFKERLAQKIRSLGQWFFRHDPFFIISQNKASAILVCNFESFNALPKRWQKKAELFPVNGVSPEDLSLFDVKTGKEDNSFMVLSAGKLIRIKGFDLAIKAFKIFSASTPDAKFIIAGDGPELKNLRNLVSELGIEDKVFFSGWLPREKLLQKMISSDIFLFASLRDGGGEVVVEAMALGKPVVCFDIAGPGFHVDEKCGIKIKPENPKQAINDMSVALEKLYFNKGLRLKLGEAAKEKIEKNYYWDKLSERLQKIYGK